ncbi:MAG TPA: VOC family protein [Pseudolysinimonas sp.]|nr:VOC family protein [Pseudolysinimonas sp.]
MVAISGGYSGFSVDDLDAALAFYSGTLGLDCRHEENGNGLTLHLGTTVVFIYPKPNHEPASYTALYLEVPDIDVAVDELEAAGIELERYEGMPHDERGILRGIAAHRGPDIAWFTDPARNIIAVLHG